MRYEDWDILLFPRDCKAPIKEFRVACHVVHDTEFSHTHGSSGIPTVCCFVPSLAAGTPFQVSMHSWCPPSVSQYTKSYSKYSDAVKFEARLFVDGRLVASTALDRMTSWPHIIAHSFSFTKSGDLELLKFPPFRRELLQQSFWTPADDLGRIKVVISEGFPRDSLSMPIERVKNIVAFSFQHAPLDILESSCIAWPNPSMWRQAPFVSSMAVPSYATDDAASHAHSPRRRSDMMQGGKGRFSGPAMAGMTGRSLDGTGPRRATLPVCSTLPHAKTAASELFGDPNAYFEWLSGVNVGVGDAQRGEGQGSQQQRSARMSSSDVSMPDYTPMELGDGLAAPAEQPPLLIGQRQEDDDVSGHLRVPTNTPTASGLGGHEQDGAVTLTGPSAVPFPVLTHGSSIPADLANSLTNSLLNQPMPVHFQQQLNFGVPACEVKSRKENRRQEAAGPSPSTLYAASCPGQDQQEMLRVSQQMYIPSGASLPVCMVPSQADGLQGQECLSSAGGESIKAPTKDGVVADKSANAGDKGTKRVRNFTPTSSIAGVDEEDGPRRVSPGKRRTPLAHEQTSDDDK